VGSCTGRITELPTGNTSDLIAWGADSRSVRGAAVKGERLSRRGFSDLASRLSERDLAIVADALQLKLLSARQIESLHFDAAQHASPLTAARTCRRVLNRLVRDGLLVRLERRTIGGLRAGSASYIYAAGPRSHRLDPDERPRRRFREPTATFVDHTLAISDLVVSLRTAERAGRLEILDLQAEPDCWRTLASHRSNMLRPDLFVALVVDDYEYHSFVEIDLATEGLPRLLGKCQTYVDYFEAGTEQHANGIFPRVVWLLNDQSRAERLRQALHHRQQHSDLFHVDGIQEGLTALSDGALNATGGAA
jgi:Replication-relaxation